MNSKEAWCAALKAAEDCYDSDIYFYSGGINDEGYGQIVAAIAGSKRHERALLVLVTDGGSANAAYQIARLFQKVYDGNFSVFCPSRCKSAGTLVVLGADRIIMDQFSELGPLDVQLFKQNEIMSRKSGLLARSAFEAMAETSFDLWEHLMIAITVKSQGNISFKLASEVSASMAARLMSGVYGQMNPEVVGSEKRDLEIAKEYGERLIETSSNATTESVAALIYNYPSHDFVIDNEEASNLFKNVDFPDDSLYQLVAFLGDSAYDEATPTIALALGGIEDVDEEEEEETDDNDLPGAAEQGGGSAGAEQPVDEGGGPHRPSDPEPEASGLHRSEAGSNVVKTDKKDPDVPAIRLQKDVR